MLTQKWKQLQEIKQKHATRFEAAFFLGGFLFDLLLVSDVDDAFAIFQQGLYLFIIALLLHFEMLYHFNDWKVPAYFEKVWKYRAYLLQFMLGTLLNIYSIFYIKSASLMASLVFLILMTSLILANELPFVKKSKVNIKVGLFAICLFSYFSILFPLILGYLGWAPFGLAMISTMLVFYAQYRLVRLKIKDEKTLLRSFLGPSVSVLGLFLFFYFLGWIPPVPLSAKTQGIYHLVEKRQNQYFLSFEKKWWMFWQNSDSEFRAEPGDRIYYYTQIYSPARIRDSVFITWFWRTPSGIWKQADKLPLNIIGGRKLGFRGYVFKNNIHAGDWKIVVETQTGLEIARLNFTVEDVPQNPTREFKVIER